MSRVEQVLRHDHPAARGHFEGNPIIPGAWLLSEVVRAAGGSAPLVVSSAKFLRAARPGDRIVIEFSRTQDVVRFACSVAGQPVLTGQMSCPSQPTSR
jgi:3-hydroxymyristoyl/3-hydroxydecanoyl-(acyl carrier protein) dehydratase